MIKNAKIDFNVLIDKQKQYILNVEITINPKITRYYEIDIEKFNIKANSKWPDEILNDSFYK